MPAALSYPGIYSVGRFEITDNHISCGGQVNTAELAGQAAAATRAPAALFIGVAAYQQIVLPAIPQPFGDPPAAIRRTAVPPVNRSEKGTVSGKSKKRSSPRRR